HRLLQPRPLFSGPGLYFPDIMAPGENIRSSVPGGGYQGGWSGTSMAGPHATALIGLMWSACPAFQGMVEQTYDIIKATAAPLTGQGGSNCGGDYTTGPNNDWGYGTIDAVAAVNGILALCTGQGYLDGHVTDALTSQPIQNATITAVRTQGGVWVRQTDATGYYTMTVPQGDFTVTATHPHYTTASQSAVVITDTVTTVDFALTPRGRLFGYVTDYDNGFPLEGATVTADDGTSDDTDATGYYEMYLDAGTHVVTATMQNYAPDTAGVVIVAGQDTQQDFALQAAVAFIPSPVHVTLPWNTLYNTGVTLTNRLPWDYDFEFVEQPAGFIPALAARSAPAAPPPVAVPNVPVFTGIAPEGYVPEPAPALAGIEGVWEARAATPFASMDNVFIEYNGMGYLIGGYGAYGQVGIYDPVNNSWTTGATEPAPQIAYTVDGCFGFNENGEPVIVLFNDTTSGVTTLHRYNIATNSWDTPPVPVGFPANGLWAADMESIWRWTGQNVCYISGGATAPGGGNQSTLYEYHPDTNTVVNLGNFTLHPAGFDFHASWYVPWIGSAGAICVGGGVDSGSVVFPDTQCYDIEAGAFNAPNADLGPMLEGVWGTADGVLYENGDYLLYVADGADAYFSLWPRSMYYSRNDGQWHYGPNPLYSVYRVEGDNVGDGAGCDFYVVTGSAGGFSPTTYNERNVSASDECPPTAGADCTWLAEVPISGTVPAQSSIYPTLYFSATPDVGVDQPGDYICKLKVQGNPAVTVRVTMTVLPAATWGKLEGTVTGLGYCDANPAPLEKATVLITTTSGMTWSLKTDEFGHYQRWIDQSESPVSVYVSYPGHEDALATGVVIVGGMTTTVDFDLRWLQPCVGVEPDAIDVTLDWGDSATVPMTVTNAGPVSLDFVLGEEDRGWEPFLLGAPVEVTIPAGPATAPAGTAVAAGPYAAVPERTYTVLPRLAPTAAPNVLLLHADDGNGEPIRSQLLAFGDIATVDVYDARSGTPDLSYLQNYDVVLTWSDYVYADPNGIGNVLADYVDAGGKVINLMFSMGTHGWQMGGRFMSEGYTAMNGTGILYSTSCLGTYDPSHPIMQGVTNVCDLYRLDGTYLTPDSTAVAYWQDGRLFVAAKDNRTVVSIAGYVGVYRQWTGQMDLLVHNAIFWLLVSPDVPWLFEAPISGTVAPDGGTFPVDVTVDSAYVNQPGRYWATLHVESNDPVVDDYPVLVTMTVRPAANMGKVMGTILDNCTGEPVEATVTFQGGIPITQTTSDPDTGRYAAWLVAGTYPVAFSADGYLDYNTSVQIVAGMTATLDVMLVPDRACIAVEPDRFEVWLLEGTAVYTHVPGLDIYNGGGQDLEFQFFEISGSVLLGNKVAPAGASSAVAPAGYTPTPVRSTPSGGWPLGGTVCIFKDANPWGSTATENILSANGIPYEVHTSAEFGSLDFSQYGMIVFSGDQPQSFYDNYAAYVGKFEDYVNAGGFLNFFSCDSGWNGGSLTAPLPGGMQWTGWIYENYNVIDDPTHPVVQGVPSPFYGNYASHGHFSNLPADAHIIAHEQIGGQPTIVEYGLGAGWFIAFGQPLEISYDWGWDAGTILWNTLLWGYAYIPAGDVWWVWEEPISGTVPSLSGGDVDIAFTALYTDTTPMPPGTYTATLLLVNNAAEGTQKLPAIMHIVSEFIPPTASFESNSPVCLGETMVFTDTSDPGVPDQIIAWAWDLGDGGTSTETNPTHLYAAPGTYTVTLTVTQAQTYLTDTYSAVVEVLPLPEASFTYAVDELTVTFTNTSANATSYLWDFGDGITSTLSNPVHTYASEGPYTVTLWATGDCGTDDFSAQVVVGNAPVAGFESNSPVCLDAPMVFTNTTTGTPPISYEWSFGDGGTSTETNPIHTYTAAATYTVILTASNVFGTDAYSAEVEVLPRPSAAFTYTTSGLVVTFTNASQNATSYLWDFGDGITSTLSNPVHTYASGGTYTVTLTATGPCGRDTAVQVVRISLCVEPSGADFTFAPPTPLVGEVVTFTGTVVTGTEPLTWEWAFGDGGVGSGNPAAHTYTAPGDYTVVMTVTNECGQDTATYVVHVAAACEPPSGADFTWTPITPTVGQSVTFTGTVASGTAPFTYTWAFGDGGVGSGPVVNHTYAATGTYDVRLTVTNACGTATAM
ncbi:MAG: PKD domain-containing protein, partial [Chloroflexia bacterium]